VFQVQTRAYVYTVDGDTARQREIQVGSRRFGVVEVLGGVEEGELIVVEGIVKLRDGAKLRYDAAETAVTESSSQGGSEPAATKARS
jgi:membrane fusion protein (multidrug efflux system)